MRRVGWTSSLALSLLACSIPPGLLDAGPNTYGAGDTSSNCGETDCTGPCADAADGSYCGSNGALSDYEGDPNDLVQCEDGLVATLTTCPMDCLESGEIGADSCSIPASCGDGRVDPLEVCDGGPCCDDCMVRPSTHICEVAAESEYGCPWGVTSESDVGQHYRDRFCSGESSACDGALGEWGMWHTVTDCQPYEGCALGQTQCNCLASTGWDPPFSTAEDKDGRQYYMGGLDGHLELPLRIEMLEEGVGELRIRACNSQDAPLVMDQSVHIYFEALGGGVLFNGVLPANGSACSDYGAMNLGGDWTLGDVLDGRWRVVRPGEVASHWDVGCIPVQAQGAAGTCWWALLVPNPPRRTCLGL